MKDIYTQAELQTIVGRKGNKKIVAWLVKNRIPYLLSSDGKPLVNRQALAAIMGAPQDGSKKDIRLNFDVEGFR